MLIVAEDGTASKVTKVIYPLAKGHFSDFGGFSSLFPQVFSTRIFRYFGDWQVAADRVGYGFFKNGNRGSPHDDESRNLCTARFPKDVQTGRARSRIEKADSPDGAREASDCRA